MVVFGMPQAIAPFPVMHQQSAYAANIYSGSVKLPSHNEMFHITLNEQHTRQKNGEPEHRLHVFGFAQFEYNNKLAELSGYTPNPSIHETFV